MKKAVSTTLILVLVFSVSVFGQTRPKVEGSGNVVKKERKASYFNKVNVSTAIDLILTQGSGESITVEADDNLHEYIMTEIKDNTLSIYLEANVRKAEKMNVHVTMKDIEKIAATSAGDVVGKTVIRSNELTLVTSSAGDIDLDIDVRKLDCNISSAGDITLSGSTDELVAKLSSAGDLNAFDLTAKTGKVSVSSAGNAEINVTGKLWARSSSAGDIYFKGNPPEVDAHSSSVGNITRK
jgi:hypothetical protein